MKAKRISVYIPGDILEGLEKYRSFFNASVVCADALRAELERLRRVDDELMAELKDTPDASVLEYVAAKLGGR